ncbi:MAG TPA: bifunctional UDP-sugar hydrolase/5'-nucleotidase [Nocardioides sp.]
MSRSQSSRLRVGVGRLSALAVTAGLCAVVPVALAPSASAAPVSIQLLNFNDFHGRIDANTTKFATTIEQLRAENPNTLLMSNGDSIGASIFASAVQEDVPTLEVLNALDVATSSVGNHEFDQGYATLTGPVADTVDFDYLGANVYEKGTDTPALPEYAELEVGGLTVGVIGAVTLETADIVSPSGIETIDFGDPVEAVNRVATQLSDGDPANGEADVIVAQYHEGANLTIGLDEAKADRPEFAEIVDGTDALVDVIFTGHTHQKYAYDAPVPGTDRTRPVLQAGQYGENIGKVTLTVDSETGDVSAYTQENVARVATADTALPRVAAVDAIVDEALDYAAEVGNEPVGEITADITRAYSAPGTTDRSVESTLGTLVGNALRDGVPANIGTPDLGITNPGGLRDDLLYEGDTTDNPANTDGVVTVAEANNVLPFLNNVSLVELTGADLAQVFEQQWPVEGRTSTLRLGTSDNVSITTNPSAPVGDRVENIWIDGVLVQPEETYTVSTFSFLAGGGDSFTAFNEGTTRDTGLVDRELWFSYLEDAGPIEPDFAKHQVVAPGLPTVLGIGEVAEVGVSNLDLTSLGAPANTELTAYVVDGETGEPYDVAGEATVTDGAADIAVEVPLSAYEGDEIYLVAEPTGTAVGPIDIVDERTPSTATGPATPVTTTVGKSVQIPITVSSDASATGTVEMRWGGYRQRVAVVNGVARPTLPNNWKPGTYNIGFYYSGDAETARSAVGVRVTIDRAPSVVLLSVPNPVKAGRTATLGVQVGNSSGVPYTGRANIAYGGRGYNVLVVSGRANFTMPAGRVGNHTITVWIDGNALTAPSASTRGVRIIR